MVGPWQVPVADAAVTTTSFDVTTGEAMAMGERAPVALLDAAASARLAIAEAITNIACAPIAKLGDVKLSANWMAAAGRPGEDARLYDAVRAAGVELCPALGIAIPGRQGLDVDAHDLDRARRDPQRHRAAVAGGDRGGAGQRRAPRADARAVGRRRRRRRRAAARRSRARQEPAGRVGAGAGLRPARRGAARSRRSRAAQGLLRGRPGAVGGEASSRRITIAATAACS